MTEVLCAVCNGTGIQTGNCPSCGGTGTYDPHRVPADTVHFSSDPLFDLECKLGDALRKLESLRAELEQWQTANRAAAIYMQMQRALRTLVDEAERVELAYYDEGGFHLVHLQAAITAARELL